MARVRVFHDCYRNTAVLQETQVFPYYGAACKKPAYRLVVKADYDDQMLTYASVFETEREAMDQLSVMGCGTFRECVPQADYWRFLNRLDGPVCRA